MDAKDYEYAQIPLNIIPKEIRIQYKLDEISVNEIVYVEIRKGMLGLRQARKIAHDRQAKHISAYGYKPRKRTPFLWKNGTRPASFTLVVDNFGVKYKGKHHVQHLMDALQSKHTITVDWIGKISSASHWIGIMRHSI